MRSSVCEHHTCTEQIRLVEESVYLTPIRPFIGMRLHKMRFYYVNYPATITHNPFSILIKAPS